MAFHIELHSPVIMAVDRISDAFQCISFQFPMEQKHTMLNKNVCSTRCTEDSCWRHTNACEYPQLKLCGGICGCLADYLLEELKSVCVCARDLFFSGLDVCLLSDLCSAIGLL